MYSPLKKYSINTPMPIIINNIIINLRRNKSNPGAGKYVAKDRFNPKLTIIKKVKR
jgi:hypothetical protein